MAFRGELGTSSDEDEPAAGDAETGAGERVFSIGLIQPHDRGH